jgi:hypothetical protein
MNWVAAVGLTNYQTKILTARTFGPWTHAQHGMLTIVRNVKAANQTQINFHLTLAPPQGAAVIHEQCHVTVVNDDNDTFYPAPIGAHRQLQGPGSNQQVGGASAVGYGDIDLGHMTGKSVIYLVHYAFALTASELGVSNFVVTVIVNPALAHICGQCGMRYAHEPSGYQGTGLQVSKNALLQAHQKGWH